MAETSLEIDTNNTSDGATIPYDSDDSLPSLDFGSPSRRRTSAGTKRKRAESPVKHEVEKVSQPSGDVLQNSSNTTLQIPMPMAGKASHGQAPNTTTPSKLKTEFTHQPSLSHALDITSKTSASASAIGSTQSTSLSLESRIARSKLLAFSKLVSRKLPARPATAPPLVTEHTLNLIIRARPQTQDELERIPGIDSLLLACEKTGMDLLRNVIKFVSAPS
jgi:hypothetical protein